MDEKSKSMELKKVPMRKLMASLKSDIRKELRPSMSLGKPLKKK